MYAQVPVVFFFFFFLLCYVCPCACSPEMLTYFCCNTAQCNWTTNVELHTVAPSQCRNKERERASKSVVSSREQCETAASFDPHCSLHQQSANGICCSTPFPSWSDYGPMKQMNWVCQPGWQGDRGQRRSGLAASFLPLSFPPHSFLPAH